MFRLLLCKYIHELINKSKHAHRALACTLHMGSLQVTYAANDDCLVSAGYDQCVKIWDCKSRSIDAMQTMKAFKVLGPGE